MDQTSNSSTNSAPVVPAAAGTPTEPMGSTAPAGVTPAAPEPLITTPGSPSTGGSVPPPTDAAPAMPPEAPHGGGSLPIVIALLVIVVVAVSGGLAYYMYSQSNQKAAPAPAQNYVQDESPTAAPSPVADTDSGTTSAELDAQPIPQSGDDIDQEVNLLDTSFNDNAEQNFSDSALDTVSQ